MGFTPYEFQVEDVEKLERQPSGLIGSEMGTGKTHEAIALDEAWWKKGAPPTLVVAPLNTFDSWLEKYSMQSPHTDVTVIDRKNRDKFVTAIRKRHGDVFLMHWDALRLMPELQGFQFNLIVADEVHRATNRKAQATRALKKLHANHKLGMSGTASGDHPENLWSVLNWLWPRYYSSYWRFVKHYTISEASYGPNGGYTRIVGVNEENLPFLKKEMEPWYVRHLKKEQCCDHHPQGVMHWLPDKTYDKIWVDLSPTQRRFYDQMRQEMIAWVNEHEDTPLVAGVVVAQLARLSQMALATPSIDEEGKVKLQLPSSKIDAVKELISDQPNKQFLLYSASKQAINLAAAELNRVGIPTQTFTGDTRQSERTGMVNRFVRGDFQVFAATIQTVGEGVDGLQYATDTAIFLDRAWSTIKNQQAEDRLHRGGTKDTVQIIDVLARSTLDFGRLQRLETKWEWIKKILGDPSAAQSAEMRRYAA